MDDPQHDQDDRNDDDEGVLDRMRGSGVGVEDPNIVGDVGPTDIPPGQDDPEGGLIADADQRARDDRTD